MPRRMSLSFLGVAACFLAGALTSSGIAQTTPAEAEARRLREENKRLLETVGEQQKQLLQQQDVINKLKEQSTTREVETKLLYLRMELLTARLAELEKALAGRGVAEPARNPPPEVIEGLVKQVDKKEDLMTISVGSDSGLQKGQTLEVFRVGAKPGETKYLGTIRIVDVRPTEAVGKAVGRLSGAVQKGDRVASRIPGK